MTKKSQPDMATTNEAQGRKDAHLDLARQNAALSAQPTGLDRVRLTHNALPECDAMQSMPAVISLAINWPCR